MLLFCRTDGDNNNDELPEEYLRSSLAKESQVPYRVLFKQNIQMCVY